MRRDDDTQSNITHGSASMRGTSGHGPGLAAIGMPLLAFRRDNGTKGCALSCREGAGYRNRPTTVTRTSTHCGSPLLIENARSLRPDFWRVNEAKACDGGIAGFFRKGSGFWICGANKGLIASKLAPTFDLCLTQYLCSLKIYCGSELARDSGFTGDENLSWQWLATNPSPNDHAHVPCHGHTANRRSHRRESAGSTARCRSSRGWPGRSPAYRCRPCSARQ
ncbi:hypothetical protein PS943_02275 [Pseudomonas fluorescens]|uniref:Uncharacterized protein n=1 Tax=Pseudomonas fluorescens TaxID=294 RepID=A0A5E7W791_PSEFL|nr:hypothetical protein PS943_02275 [Pseudomonas fluorescens]